MKILKLTKIIWAHALIYALIVSHSFPLQASWSIPARIEVQAYNCSRTDFSEKAFFPERPELGYYCPDSETFLAEENPFRTLIKDIWKSKFSGSKQKLSPTVASRIRPVAYQDYSGSKSLKVSTYFQPQYGSELVVALPAIFQGHSDSMIEHSINLLTSMGMSAVIIPNPFSTDYLAHQPSCSSANFMREAEIAYSVIKSLLQVEGYRFSKVHLVGVSYGAFLSSLVVAMDSQSDKLITGKLMLLGPPLDLYQSLEHFDNVLANDRILGENFSQGYVANHIKGKIKNFIHDSNRYRPDAEAVCQLEHPLMRGQQAELNSEPRSASISLLPSGVGGVKRSREVNFLNSIEDLSPDVYQLFKGGDSKLTSIGHWLGIAHQNGFEKIQIFTTMNDYINDFEQWLHIPEPLLTQSHLLIRATGGHNGFIFSKWYENFIAYVFDKPVNADNMTQEKSRS